MVTKTQLLQLFPSARPALVDAVVKGWPKAEAADITTPTRIADFLSNIGVETGGLRAVEENLSYSSAARIRKTWPKRFANDAAAQPYVRQPKKLAIKVYGARMGNRAGTEDGWTYRGGGMKQTTGRENYSDMGFEDNPEKLREPDIAFETAVREWVKRGCNKLSDAGNVTALRKAINGGTNGLADVKAYRAKALTIFAGAKAAPKSAPNASPKPAPAGPKLYTDKTTVEVVQRKLKDLGYTEVGGVDGVLGKLSRAAILAFRDDNGLPLTPTIDDALLAALDDAKARQLAPKREEAAPADVREKVPEVRANWLSKVGAWVVGIPAAAGALFDGLLGNLGSARGYVEPLRETFGDVPGWVWLGSVALIAGGLYLIASRGERKGVEAWQSGARR